MIGGQYAVAAMRRPQVAGTFRKSRLMSTTNPSASTDANRGRRLPLGVRWVFPSPITTTFIAHRHVIGREASCDAVLSGTEISREHAEFLRDGPVLTIRDLKSRNGVFVNGVRCANTPLVAGDVLRCGEWVGVVVGDEDPAGFREIAAGWYGGSLLAAAAEPAKRVAVDLPIVIQGETGTGKEGMARAIHNWSGRRGSFVAVNCAAIPAHLAEAELFGYRKGAFTGADKASPGLFRAAQGGTLFLDEILELPSAVQPKLLRVLEQREVLALGETSPVAIDVRVLAAAQESLASAVTDGRFRSDLHARLDGLTILLPPLRGRREDIVPLFQEFLRQQTGGRALELEPKLIEALAIYEWPLNVRELFLVTRRLVGVYGTEATLKKAHLPERMLRPPTNTSDPKASGPIADSDGTAGDSRKRAWRKTDDEAEFEALVHALRIHNGSVAKAAAAIGVSRARAYRVLSAHPDFSVEPPIR